MGSIIISGGRSLETLSDIAGYKCGLALGRDDLMTIFASEARLQPYLGIDDIGIMRLHSVEYEDAIEALRNRGKTPGDYAGWQRMRIRSAKLGTIG